MRRTRGRRYLSASSLDVFNDEENIYTESGSEVSFSRGCQVSTIRDILP